MDTGAETTPAALSIIGLDGANEIRRTPHSVIYRAWQAELNRSVAVKVLTAEGFLDDRQRQFQLELLAMGRLSRHPNVLTVHASGATDAGRPYVVMDLMDGGSLEERVAANGPLPWTDAVEVGVKIGSALETSHRSRILHGDVSPGHVFVSEYGEPVLAAFGAPPFERHPETNEDLASVSVDHAAPEILAGGAPSIASDVYSLASTIYTLIRGHAPFRLADDDTAETILHRASTTSVPDLGASGVPAEVGRALDYGLSANPDDRPHTVSVFLSELRAAQAAAGVETTDLVIPIVEGSDDDEQRRRPGAHFAGRQRPSRFRRIAIAAVAAVVVVGAGFLLFGRRSSGTSVPTATLTRYVNDSSHDRLETTGGPPSEYVQDVDLGRLPRAQVDNGHAVYACMYQHDHFLSPDAGCEGYPGGQRIGYAYTSRPAGQRVEPLFRCWSNDHTDHFVSNDPYCEGQTLYGMLGYVLADR